MRKFSICPGALYKCKNSAYAQVHCINAKISICQGALYKCKNSAYAHELHEFKMCVARYHTQPLTLWHNCAYSMPSESEGKCTTFLCVIFQSLLSVPLWWQPWTVSLSVYALTFKNLVMPLHLFPFACSEMSKVNDDTQRYCAICCVSEMWLNEWFWCINHLNSAIIWKVNSHAYAVSAYRGLEHKLAVI